MRPVFESLKVPENFLGCKTEKVQFGVLLLE